MSISLRTKLSISYISVILICVTIISLLSNIMLERQFRDYIMKQQEQKTQDIISQISQRYDMLQDWDINYIQSIGMNALENGLIIKIVDPNNNVIWDANTHNDGLCQQMLTNMSQNMQGRYQNDEGGYEEKTYAIEYKSKTIALISVGYYGPYYYTDSDLNFIDTINKLLIGVGAFSLALALMLGIIMSRQLSKPISRVIQRAKQIAQGSYGEKIDEKSSTTEITLLIDTFNSLADTLKTQEALSKQSSIDITHELRTPLTTIQGNLEAAIDGVMVMDEDRIKILHEEILRINRLVDDLAKLSRYESLNLIINKTKFDISELLTQIVNTFENDFSQQDKKISFVGESIEIFADKDKINQVIVNILSNALRYTKPKGLVEVMTHKIQDNIHIQVKDNGIGISNDDLPHLFDRFYRVDKSRNHHTGGTGIGLTIAKKIITNHDGQINITSTLNEGTRVNIIIPSSLETATND